MASQILLRCLAVGAAACIVAGCAKKEDEAEAEDSPQGVSSGDQPRGDTQQNSGTIDPDLIAVTEASNDLAFKHFYGVAFLAH